MDSILFDGLAGLVYVGAYVFGALCLMLIAKKTDTPNAWLAWIPIANLYLMTEIAGVDWWWMILCFVPFVNLIAMVYLWMKISEARGQSEFLGLLILVPCVNLLFIAYLAFAD